MVSLMESNTWKLVSLPPGRQAIKGRWIFRIKRDANGIITRYKARLCACVYSQIHGVDVTDIYAPIVRSVSLRLLMSIVASRNMELYQMNVTSAFSNGDLGETIYMRQPAGFTSKNNRNFKGT